MVIQSNDHHWRDDDGSGATLHQPVKGGMRMERDTIKISIHFPILHS